MTHHCDPLHHGGPWLRLAESRPHILQMYNRSSLCVHTDIDLCAAAGWGRKPQLPSTLFPLTIKLSALRQQMPKTFQINSPMQPLSIRHCHRSSIASLIGRFTTKSSASHVNNLHTLLLRTLLLHLVEFCQSSSIIFQLPLEDFVRRGVPRFCLFVLLLSQ